MKYLLVITCNKYGETTVAMTHMRKYMTILLSLYSFVMMNDLHCRFLYSEEIFLSENLENVGQIYVCLTPAFQGFATFCNLVET